MALHIVTHPLVQHKLSLMRNKGTGVKEFRELTEETAMLICYEAMRDLPMQTVKMETPQGWAETKIISGKKLAFVPILRAGLGLLEGVTSLIPAAKIGHIGIFCEPGTHDAVKYYSKMPDDITEREVVVIDAMLATGASAITAIQDLKDMGVKNIKFLCILCSPEGKAALEAAHPDVDIYCAGMDQGINEEGYIIPGLGDAGDRMFGTK
jgi:uracil phosphoribosyltransferase